MQSGHRYVQQICYCLVHGPHCGTCRTHATRTTSGQNGGSCSVHRMVSSLCGMMSSRVACHLVFSSALPACMTQSDPMALAMTADDTSLPAGDEACNHPQIAQHENEPQQKAYGHFVAGGPRPQLLVRLVGIFDAPAQLVVLCNAFGILIYPSDPPWWWQSMVLALYADLPLVRLVSAPASADMSRSPLWRLRITSRNDSVVCRMIWCGWIRHPILRHQTSL